MNSIHVISVKFSQFKITGHFYPSSPYIKGKCTAENGLPPCLLAGGVFWHSKKAANINITERVIVLCQIGNTSIYFAAFRQKKSPQMEASENI